MITPVEALEKCKKHIKKEWKLAFVSAFVIGLLVHLPIMLSDIPNHDGLSSMHFDQNMITSGRWFLTVACGLSSYFTLPWMIGILALLYLACTAVVLTELLELRDKLVIVLVSGLLVVFPAVASTFAYVFTMDGYMMALFLAVLSVYLVGKYKYGFVAGGVCLAFSMGIYQAYLPFAIILCIYMIALLCMEKDGIKAIIQSALKYLYMGGIGVVLYYVILQILLKIQGKELASYQGISGMGGENASGVGILGTLKEIYLDFAVFTLKGNVFFNNIFSMVALLALVAVFAGILIFYVVKRKWWKNPGFFVIMGLLLVGLPFATNIILLISPNVTYHLLMRYQWVLYLILMIGFVHKFSRAHMKVGTEEGMPGEVARGMNEALTESLADKASKEGAVAQNLPENVAVMVQWLVTVAAAVLLFNYAITDNIGYSNLEKRYEKTYAYCVRLLDRMEQAEGYYQGIPIAIVGIVGYDEFPDTDITTDVTGGMIGLSGETLLYTADNYETFMKNYLGATLNFLDVETVGQIYYTDEYIAMDTFPGENSVKVVDGILYVKTENVGRD